MRGHSRNRCILGMFSEWAEYSTGNTHRVQEKNRIVMPNQKETFWRSEANGGKYLLLEQQREMPEDLS